MDGIMNREQWIRNLSTPDGPVDMILDTDAFNEVDDQFAISYMLCSPELHPVAINAAPFFNTKSTGPEDGMEKSYHEILHVLELAGRADLKGIVYKGSREYLKDEHTPVVSPAAENICRLASRYSPEKPLYVVAIAAITNVASALLMKPEIKENIVVVWLGGHSWEIGDPTEFNMKQDIAGARVVMGSGVPFVQLPCNGVVSEFRISKPELEYWLYDKNSLADYLARYTVSDTDAYAAGKPWSRPIWDVTAVAWLLNKNGRFMGSRIEKTRLPGYDRSYHPVDNDAVMSYVVYIARDALMKDLIDKLVGNDGL